MAEQAQTVNESLADQFLKRQIYLERYKLSVVKRIRKLLAEVDPDIVAKLATVQTEWSQNRLELMLDEIRAITTALERRIYDELNGELSDLAIHEGEFTAKAFQASLPTSVRGAISFIVPSDAVLVAAATSRPFAGKILKDWTKSLMDGELDRIKQAVRIGFVEGEGIDKIVRRVTGTKAMGYADGVRGVTRNQAEALVRTAVQHTAQAAKNEVFKASAPLLRGVQYLATLDGRTTLRCASLDRKVFPVDSGPRPPQHFRCRSSTAGITRSWSDLGLGGDIGEIEPDVRPFVRSTQRLKDVPKADRDRMVGTVSANTTYNDWLKKQDAGFVTEVLGPTKAQLFQKSSLTIDKFVDRQGSELSLSQLKSKYASEWKAAGLD